MLDILIKHFVIKKQECILLSRNLFSFVVERQATDLRVWF